MFNRNIVFVLLLCMRSAWSIRCYECNSQNNTMCLDPTLYDQDTLAKFLPAVTCGQGVVSANNHGFFCRKIVQTSESIKCFDCSSVNNSACLDVNLQQMHAVVPVVDCAKSLPEMLSKQFFCRKMIQTILHPEKTPEVRVHRSCGWVKHKRECYKADNADHLETVCQCFGDMCNAASTHHLELTALLLIGWRLAV